MYLIVCILGLYSMLIIAVVASSLSAEQLAASADSRGMGVAGPCGPASVGGGASRRVRNQPHWLTEGNYGQPAAALKAARPQIKLLNWQSCLIFGFLVVVG